jgi:hypothetical protein
VAAVYAYGALVHILNITSKTGSPWPDAPMKWQILDIVYLVLDIVFVVGLIKGSWIGVGAFFLAAMSQIMLYTILRHWVLDVPAVFQCSAEDFAYLDGLVGFYVLTCIAVASALVVMRMSSMMHPDDGH